MTVDERLDRLTERHEALAQSLELLTADVRDLTADLRGLTANVNELTMTVNRMGGMMENLMTGFGAIAELVRRHETRLDRLEGTA